MSSDRHSESDLDSIRNSCNVFIVTVVFDNAKYRNKNLTNKFFFWLQVWDLEGAQLLLAMILWLIWRNDKND